MAKQLNVDLRFTASNTQAKQQIQDLQSALNNLMTTASKNTTGLGITKDIAQATNEVAKLQAMLESSKNASGGLDLGKFNQSLSQGQIKISDYARTLSSLGPQGDQAFAKLAKAIINAEVPLKRTNSVLKEFKTSLMNTARWQLSSSMLHGFMGAVQSAYGYAQDLNESLNNIRIVTGANIDEMSRFAKEANAAAQALSTTTTEYTNASLIFYQQGLNDEEVAKRTEVTVKMANAAGESAQKISDQLTAVWNNFYDGSKSLEYYADVMTALGAATASSTDEIAGGLEKFAAIGQTIGLSYEYAASALATITSNTRQSEEVVGTALKTIFARIQGLNLGETLEDGTSLNKYSEALSKIGISIFEQNGEIKKMDNILNEMAEKWGTLAKDQQIALAQTVAGVRQYTQLIALMDNWNAGDSDSMAANLNTAYNATGTLQKQADIYAESWEAAKDRVTAAAEEIYNQLLNDEFFIDLNNGFAGFLNIISDTIDALGGLPGVLTVASSIMFKMFGKDMAKAIDDWGYNIKLRSKEGVQEILNLRQQSIQALKNVYSDNVDTGPTNAASQASFESQALVADTLLVKRQELLANGQALSEEDERQAQLLLQINEAYGEQAVASARSLENAQKQSDLLESQARTQIRRYNNAQTDPNNKINLTAELNQIKQAQIQYSTLEATFNKLSRAKSNFNSGDEMIQALRTMSETATAAGMDMTAFEQVLAKLSTGMSVDEVLNAIETEMNQIGDAAYNNIEKVNGLREKLQQIGMSDEQINKLIASWERQGIITSEVAEHLRNVKVQGDEAAAAINRMQGPPPTVGQKFMAVANTISNIAMSINVVKGLIDTWNNEDMSFGEKLLSTFTSLGVVIPMVTTALTGNNLAMLGSVSSSIAAAVGFDGVAISAKVAAGGVGALWAALWPIALVVAGLTLVITALAAGVKYLSDEYNKDAIAANKAAEAANNLKEAYEETKKSYEDMISAMENYQSARDSLDNLTKGTEAYRDALNEANEAALQLIKAGNLIRGEDYDIVGGEIIIKQESIDAAKENQYGKVQEAYAASTMANANASRLKAEADQTKLTRTDDKSIWQGVVEGMVTGMAALMITGNAPAALAGALTGGVIGAIDTALINKAGNEAQQKQIDDLVALYDEMGEAAFDSVELQKLGIDTANEEYINSLKEIVRATHQAAEEMEVAAELAATSILSQDERFAKSQDSEELYAASGEIYNKLYQDNLKKYQEVDIANWVGAGTEDAKDLWNKYLEASGLGELRGIKATNFRKDNTVDYEYYDEEGKKQEANVDLATMAAAVAAAEANNLLADSANVLLGIFNELNNSGNEAAQALKNIIAYENVEKSTRAEFDDLKNEYESAEDKTAYLNEAFGGADGVIDEAELKALGYDSIEALQAGIEQAIEDGEDAWDDVGKHLTSTAKKAFKNSMDSGIFDDLTLEQTNQMADLFQDAFAKGGVEGLDSLQNSLNVMFEKSGQDAGKMAAILANVDWQTTNIEDLTAILEDAGIETDGFANELENLIELMQEGQNIGFDGAADIYKTAHEIIDDLKTGDTISSEDYDNLKTMGINMSDYFVQMADGSYKLTADAKEFYDVVNAKTLEQFQNNIDALRGQKADVNNLQNSTYDKDSIATMDTNMIGMIKQDDDKLGDQLTFLKAIGSDLENLDSYIQEIEAGGQLTQRQLREIRNELEENAWQWDNLSQVTEGFDAEIQRNMDAYAMSATTVGDLNDMLREGLINAEAYNKAIESVMDVEFEAEGLDVEAANDVADAFREMADAGEAGTEALKDNEEAVKDATVRYMELNEAITDIYDNYDDYIDVLKAARKASTPLEKANLLNEKSARSLRTSLAGLLGTTEDLIDADLMAAINPADFEAAANGSVEAIDRIREAFIKLQIEGIDGITLDGLMAELNAFNDGAYIDLDNMPMLWSLIEAKVAAGATAADIEALLSGLNIDADVSDFYGTMEEMAAIAEQAGSRVVQATSFSQTSTTETEATPRTVDNVNFTETVTTTNHPSIAAVPMTNGFGPLIYGTNMVSYQKSVSVDPVSYQTQDTATATEVVTENAAGEEGKVRGIQINGAHKAPTASRTPSPTNTTRKPVSSGSSGGGSSGSKAKEPSKPKQMDTTKQTDVVKRYKEIDDALDDLSDEYDKASKSADRLWGEHRLDALREQNALIEEQQELLAEKQRQAERYMKQDQVALQQAAAAAGLAFSFDDKGNITNYTDQMTVLYNQLAAAESRYNSLATGEAQESYEETILEPLKNKIQNIEDAMELYEESKELFEELGINIEDLQDQIMQNNYDIIMDGLELHIGFNEEDLEIINYYLSKIEDDFYSMAEAAALIANPKGNSQLTEYISNLEEYESSLQELNKAYAAGEITEAMYQEGLEEVRSGIRDNLSSLVELDNTMKEYYSKTLDMAQEELAKYTDRMEHQTEVLEHYQSLMEILGKETDYNGLGIILEGQAKTIENQMKVAKEAYAMYQSEADEKKKLLDQAIATGNTEAAEVYQKEWEAANAAAMEAQQDMLDKTEEWADALRAILENKLSGFAQDLENALTGGTSFDTLTTSMERAASLQEEYLTTTNQIYETNKLMRVAQQAIDNSTSSIAKQKLKGFINETKQLQDQTKLSQYELEIQQAKYNLLLAEMALEDARDAKTVVRLKRDNEGNLGYVYTADQDKLAEAQQELEDAQNSLYNIGLEGANEYSEKYQQTMSEMYDTFTELQEQYLSGEFETEAEYQDAMLKAKEYYYEKLKNYSSLHQIALTTDSRVIADAWSSDYSEMIFNTEDWMRAVTEYVGNVNLAFDEWEENVDTITNETLGPNLDTLEDNVKDITDANDALTDSIVKDGGVIDAIESELDQVSELTGKYANLRQQIQGLIADHETLMVRIGNEPNPYTPPGTGTSGSSSSSGGSSGSSNSGNSSSGSGRGSSTASTSSGTSTKEASAPEYSDTTKQGVALAIWNGGFGWGNGTTRRNRLDEKGFDPEEIQRIVDITNPNGDWRTRYGISDLSKYAYSSFDTGGYTGAWGSYGKFAMLHEKELILNPGETENFLASMEVLRSIIKMIDLQSTASQLGGLLHSPGYYAPQSPEVLEQNVHIEASFPEATDRYEIEAALTSIVNRASQFANRK